MNDLAEKLTDLLNDPNTIQKIKNLSNLINKENINNLDDLYKDNKFEKFSANIDSSNPLNSITESLSQNNHNSSDTDNNNLLSPEFMNSLIKILPIIISSINKNDKYSVFFYSLRPLLSTKRQKKLDQAIKIFKLMKLFYIIKKQEIF